MNNCNDCGTPLVILFQTSWYCPNNCDIKKQEDNYVDDGEPKDNTFINKKWWTWCSSGLIGVKRNRKFLLLSNSTDKAPTNIPTYEIRLIGKYNTEIPPRIQDKLYTVISPGPKGIIMEKVQY